MNRRDDYEYFDEFFDRLFGTTNSGRTSTVPDRKRHEDAVFKQAKELAGPLSDRLIHFRYLLERAGKNDSLLYFKLSDVIASLERL